MFLRLVLMLALFLFPAPRPSSAAPLFSAGELDQSFGQGGYVITNLGSSQDIAWDMALQPDGRILLAGQTGSFPDVDFALLRYNSDGSPDTSFDTDGLVTVDLMSNPDYGQAVALQDDGRIVIAGTSDLRSCLVRLNPDGSLDTSFGSNGTVVTSISKELDQVSDLAIQEDGKILLAGYNTSYGNDMATLARFNADGSLDAAFGSAGVVITDIDEGDDRISALLLQNDGKIVLVGAHGTQPDYNIALLRYLSDGSLDPDFGSGGLVSTDIQGSPSLAYAAALQPDGKILAAGVNDAIDFVLLRYNQNGSLDSSFGSNGVTIIDVGGDIEYPQAVFVTPWGGIMVVGHAKNGSEFDLALVRLYKDGSLDQSFGQGGIATCDLLGDDAARAAVPDGRNGILVAGSSSTGSDVDLLLARFHSQTAVPALPGGWGLTLVLLLAGAGLLLHPRQKR